MTSARERIEKGLRVLEKVIARVKNNQKVWEIIDGNGHVKAFWAVDFLWLGLIAKRFYQLGFH